MMPVISAAGFAYKPIIVYSRKRAHYRIVSGVVQTVQSFFPPCYFYQRPLPGVDSQIILDWAKGFKKETFDLRRNGQKLLHILDGYGSHIQFSFLKALRESGIIAVALPSLTSHVL